MKDQAFMFILTPSEIQGQMRTYFTFLNNGKKEFYEKRDDTLEHQKAQRSDDRNIRTNNCKSLM